MNDLPELTRRRFLGNVYTGLAGVGLIQLLSDSVHGEEIAWQPDGDTGDRHHG